jgi:hypothetical protein
MIESNCQVCGNHIIRNGSVAGKSCSRECAAELRRRWKPVSKEWLEQKYVVEKLGTVQIARLVNRHPKRVYEWLVNLGIPLREKWQGNVPPRKPYHNAEWLKEEYEVKGRTLANIGEECAATSITILKYLRKHGIASRTTAESCKLAGTRLGLRGPKNPMFGKRGADVPSWKGGCTPERQAFYSSEEWAKVSQQVWKRDNATCQRCFTRKQLKSQRFCIHHLVSFAVKELRAELSNLVLLCEPCHNWIHSNANVNREFIREVPVL